MGKNKNKPQRQKKTKKSKAKAKAGVVVNYTDGNGGKKPNQNTAPVAPVKGQTKPRTVTYNAQDWDDDWGLGGYGGAGGGMVGGKCRHYGTKIEVADGVNIFCSSMSPKRKEDEFVPDFGLYADWGWKVADWRCEHIDWPDHGVPNNKNVAFQQILDTYEQASEGLDVEIGCIGGHGRTGTILACYYVLGGLTADEARKKVWSDYCNNAIESKAQEWYVEWFEAIYKNEEPPADLPKPKPVVHKGGGGTGGYKATQCAQIDHFYPYLRDAEKCFKGVCTFWARDEGTFKVMEEKGTWTASLLGEMTLKEHRTAALKHREHPKVKEEREKRQKTTTTTTYPANKTGVVSGGAPEPTKVYVALTEMEDGKLVERKFKVQLGKKWNIKTWDYSGEKEVTKMVNRKDHQPAEDICNCDACHYWDLGHGYFLEPQHFQQAGDWAKEMDRQEAIAETRIALREDAEKKDDEVKTVEQKSAAIAAVVHAARTASSTPPVRSASATGRVDGSEEYPGLVLPNTEDVTSFWDPESNKVKVLINPERLSPINPQIYRLTRGTFSGAKHTVRVSGEFMAMPTGPKSLRAEWVFFPWRNIFKDPRTLECDIGVEREKV